MLLFFLFSNNFLQNFMHLPFLFNYSKIGGKRSISKGYKFGPVGARTFFFVHGIQVASTHMQPIFMRGIHKYENLQKNWEVPFFWEKSNHISGSIIARTFFFLVLFGIYSPIFYLLPRNMHSSRDIKKMIFRTFF